MNEVAIGLVVFAAAGVGFFLVARRSRNERQAAMQRAASQLGLIWSGSGSPHLRDHLADFHLFRQGTSQRVLSELTGQTKGVAVTVIDYKFGNITNNVTNRYLALLLSGNSPKEPFLLQLRQGADQLRSRSPALEALPALHDRYVIKGGSLSSPTAALLAMWEEQAASGCWLEMEVANASILVYHDQNSTPTTADVSHLITVGLRASALCN